MHASMITIRDKISPSIFLDVEIDNDEIKIEIHNLNAKKKAIPQNNIPNETLFSFFFSICF